MDGEEHWAVRSEILKNSPVCSSRTLPLLNPLVFFWSNSTCVYLNFKPVHYSQGEKCTFYSLIIWKWFDLIIERGLCQVHANVLQEQVQKKKKSATFELQQNALTPCVGISGFGIMQQKLFKEISSKGNIFIIFLWPSFFIFFFNFTEKLQNTLIQRQVDLSVAHTYAHLFRIEFKIGKVDFNRSAGFSAVVLIARLCFLSLPPYLSKVLPHCTQAWSRKPSKVSAWARKKLQLLYDTTDLLLKVPHGAFLCFTNVF